MARADRISEGAYNLEKHRESLRRRYCSLTDNTAMPPDLRNAHRENDAAVCCAYGWPRDISETEIVTLLFELYDEFAAK